MHRFALIMMSLAVACASESAVSCGAGTLLSGRSCVPDSDGAAPHDDAGLVQQDAAQQHDSSSGDGSVRAYVNGDRCPTDSMGHNLLSPSCVGNNLQFCGGEVVRVTNCAELGTRCLPGENGMLPRCDGGVYQPCVRSSTRTTCADTGHALLCGGGYPNETNFTYTIACEQFGAGYTCRSGATESGCAPPNTVSCDPSMPDVHCSTDGTSIIRCADGLQYTIPCESRMRGSVCDIGASEPVCVPPGAGRCNPVTFAGSCLTDSLALQCDILTYHTTLTGCRDSTQCRVNGGGRAVCAEPTANNCDPASHVLRCADRNQLIECNGIESPRNCSTIGQGWRCIPGTPARCGQAIDCDPTTYVAQCSNGHALNCRNGILQDDICPQFLVCAVRSSVAGCI